MYPLSGLLHDLGRHVAAEIDFDHLLTLCLFWNVVAFARQPTSHLPDPDLTPGDVFDVSLTDICTPGYSKTVRAVPKYLRDQAFRNYGLEPHQRSHYQLDHLIPLAIGGSNSVRNLWPQPYSATPWGAAPKTDLRTDFGGSSARDGNNEVKYLG